MSIEALKNEVLGTIKHIESDVSGIIGFGGPAESLARELGKKVRAVIDKLEGHGEAPAVQTVVSTDPFSPVVSTQPVETEPEAEAEPSKTK